MGGLPPLAPLPAPAYFLSDAHLGAALCPNPEEQLARLHGLLERVLQQGRSLTLVGDLFDFWYEWKHVVPKRHFGVLSHLRTLADRGIALHYLAGNHDFRLRGFLESEVGLQVHQDSMAAAIGGQAVFIFHGDGILARDPGYRLVKRILRNRVAQNLFLWIHPDLGMRLARGTSVSSRSHDRIRPRDEQEYLAYARGRFAEGYSGVVLGHTHRPVEHAEGSCTYINLGDWITHYTYGVHDGNRLALHRWPE